MGASGDHRLIAARDLVLALGPGLNASEAVIDRPFDRSIIAELEMEEGHLFGATPVAAVERVAANEVQRAGHRQAAAAGEKQQHLVAHPLGDEIEELPGEIGPSPLPRACVLVKGPHRLPFHGPDLGTAKHSDLESIERGRALLAQRLALAAGQ